MLILKGLKATVIENSEKYFQLSIHTKRQS